MTLRAKLITEANRTRITNLNGGVTPAEQTFDMNTFFVYSDQGSRPNEIMTRDEFKQRFRWITSGRNDNIIEEI